MLENENLGFLIDCKLFDIDIAINVIYIFASNSAFFRRNSSSVNIPFSVNS